MTLKIEKWFIVVGVIGILLWWFYSWQLGTTVLIIGCLFQIDNFIEDIRIKINSA